MRVPCQPNDENSPLPSTSSPSRNPILRLRGGGGDGGSTGAESRSCYLEMYAGKKLDAVDPRLATHARWTQCALSNEPLHPPVVADELGSLFNKEAVLQALLTRTMPPSMQHVSLKSILELKLHRDDGATQRQEDDDRNGAADADALYSCPVTGQPMNGRFKFVANRRTGLVVSDKALRQVPLVVTELTGKALGDDEWLPLCPVGDELEALKLRVEARLAKSKKKKRVDVEGDIKEVKEDKRVKAASPPAVERSKVLESLFIKPEDKQDYTNDFMTRGSGARGMRM